MVTTPYCDLCGDDGHSESSHKRIFKIAGLPDNHPAQADINKWYREKNDKKYFSPCADVRPNRMVLCQGEKGHTGSHHAVVYWEDEE